MPDSLTTASAAATPIHVLTGQTLENWLQNQDAKTRQAVAAQGFSGEPGTFAILCDADGGQDRVLAGASDGPSLWSCAALPLSLPPGDYRLATAWSADDLEAASIGWALGAYQFTRYRQASRQPARLALDPQCRQDRINALLNGIALTRDLINTPAQDMMPEHLAEQTAELARQHGADFRQWIGDELLADNFPIIHAVGRASAHPPRLLDLRWGDANQPRLTLVGKGVCFDSGGLNLKPANGMRLMKKDMGGAAHVLGLASMVMALKLPVRLRVLIPAVENAVAGNAFRPGDVLTSRSGVTVEIDNTDAEGRLVLCDALSEAAHDHPDLLIDMATLTGAARVALGPDLPGVFSQPHALALELMTRSSEVEDPIWPLPLHQPYARWLKSDIADCVNSASSGLGGAITAALYLQKFVAAETNWMHMDVMAWNSEPLPGRPRGGEAMGLRAFLTLLESRYAQ